MNTYELTAKFDKRASFYGKARIEQTKDGNGTITSDLISYTTKVCTITKKDNDRPRLTWLGGWYSATTARHINEFLRQHGIEAMSKKEMEGYKNV